jgi:hypothetical protein
MIILKTRTENETRRINFGSLVVSISLLLVILSAYVYSIGFLLAGVVIISIQDKTQIDLHNNIAIKFYNVIGIPFPMFRKQTDLNKFTIAYLYQKSEKGAIQTRAQTLSYNNTEYWIKLKAGDGSEFVVGYIRNYKVAQDHLETLQQKLNYEIRDAVQMRLSKNKSDRSKRQKK